MGAEARVEIGEGEGEGEGALLTTGEGEGALLTGVGFLTGIREGDGKLFFIISCGFLSCEITHFSSFLLVNFSTIGICDLTGFTVFKMSIEMLPNLI